MLLSSHVPKNINRKTLIFGFELFDLFLVLSSFAILNFFLIGSLFSWIITVIIAMGLYFGKKDKPEGFLLDYLQNLFSPKVFSASYPDFLFHPYLKKETLDAQNNS